MLNNNEYLYLCMYGTNIKKKQIATMYKKIFMFTSIIHVL